MERDPSVHEALEIEAEPDAVWRAWTDPDWLSGWMVERAGGRIAEGEAVTWGWDSLGVELELDVVACEPPSRLVVRGGPVGRPPRTQSVALRPVAGGTRVELEHGGFPPGPSGDDERAGTRAGWRVMLRVLAHYLERHAGRARECAAVLAPVAAPLSAVGHLLHRPEGRAAWLVDAAGPALAAEGERFALRGPELHMTGRVLALAPPFQLAVTWDEVDGVLVLRAIQVAPEAGERAGAVLAGAQAWSWSPDRPAWRDARASLAGAVARLVAAAGGATGSA
jgi:uncharacterized protein YndB with AHSA1/START domain